MKKRTKEKITSKLEVNKDLNFFILKIKNYFIKLFKRD